jgi:hypothetical protein
MKDDGTLVRADGTPAEGSGDMALSKLRSASTGPTGAVGDRAVAIAATWTGVKRDGWAFRGILLGSRTAAPARETY